MNQLERDIFEAAHEIFGYLGSDATAECAAMAGQSIAGGNQRAAYMWRRVFLMVEAMDAQQTH